MTTRLCLLLSAAMFVVYSYEALIKAAASFLLFAGEGDLSGENESWLLFLPILRLKPEALFTPSNQLAWKEEHDAGLPGFGRIIEMV